jgi:hypothetical protein
MEKLDITTEQLAALKASGTFEMKPIAGRDLVNIRDVVAKTETESIPIWVWPVYKSDEDLTVVSWLVERCN